jgi:hypothetical protein
MNSARFAEIMDVRHRIQSTTDSTDDTDENRGEVARWL